MNGVATRWSTLHVRETVEIVARSKWPRISLMTSFGESRKGCIDEGGNISLKQKPIALALPQNLVNYKVSPEVKKICLPVWIIGVSLSKVKARTSKDRQN